MLKCLLTMQNKKKTKQKARQDWHQKCKNSELKGNKRARSTREDFTKSKEENWAINYTLEVIKENKAERTQLGKTRHW